MQARNPDYQTAVTAIFRDAPFIVELGIAPLEIAVGRVTSRLAVRPQHLQHDGLVHAAVQTAIADHTAGAAAYSVIEADQAALTLNVLVNLLRPAKGDELYCQASVLRAGKRVVIVESDVFVRVAATDQLVAKATVTLAVLPRNELPPIQTVPIQTVKETSS